jgi:hypothetical protein
MDDEVGAEALRRARAGVGARYDRHAVAPRGPAGDLAEQVGPGAAALGVRPVAIGQQEDVQRARDRATLPQRRMRESDLPVAYAGAVTAPRRLLGVLAAAALVTPASAHAQGAGDDQYQDPFGASQTTTTPGKSVTQRRRSRPASTKRRRQGQPSLSPSPPARSAPQTTAPSSAPLPRTGAEVPGMALLGLGLLAAGVGLRLRTADESIY